jgi:lipopolysaccharide/colanic/teichoic acid biosynthesis glycosyltransferase
MIGKLLRWVIVADLLWIPLALILAYEWRSGISAWSDVSRCMRIYWPVLLLVVLLWAIFSVRTELHGFRGGWNFAKILSQVIVALSVLMVVLLSAAFLTRHYYSRLILGCFAVYMFVGFVAVRCCTHVLVNSRSRSGGKRRVVILGSGPIAREIAAKVLHHPEMMWEVVGFLYPSCLEIPGAVAGQEQCSVPTMEALELLKNNCIKELVVTISPLSNEIRKLLDECRKFGTRVTFVPQFYELYVSRTRLVEIDGLPLLSLEESLPSAGALLVKRISDFALASLLLLLSLPLLLLTASVLYVKKGRAFCKEKRGGKDGQPFEMYRFNIDRDASNVLARLSLTELPQLWNVLRGEMALVGPRPESMDRVKLYSDWQRQRLKMPVGVTGLAQVHGLREQHSSDEKTRFDLQYIFHWSLFDDLSLLLQTLWTLATRLGKQNNDRNTLDISEPAGGSVLIPEVADVNRA